MSSEVQEYAVRGAGGAMHVRPTGEDGVEAGWISDHQNDHGPVYVRMVIVVEDWRELPSTAN